MTKNNQRQYQVLEFIQDYIRSYNYPPSVREIASGCDMSSTATVKYYLDKLSREGIIKIGQQKNRAIELVDNYSRPINQAPIVGLVRAGEPIFAEQSIDSYITVPQEIFTSSEDIFALRVEGSSMIDAGIFDGDYILVHKQSSAENGEIVVAMIENSATVKRFYKEKNYYRLHPENKTMSDIITRELSILGVVSGLIRKM